MRQHRHIPILGAAIAALALLCIASPALGEPEAPPEVWQAPKIWQAPADGASGTVAGRMDNPHGIAADPTSGHIYVADGGNNRIDEFTSWGGFVKAFGWGVADGTSEELQTCTTTCFNGLAGDGAGQFRFPHGLAVAPGGDLYVFEEAGKRVQKLDPTAGPGEDEARFLWMAGGEVNKTKDEEGGSTEAERNLCTAGTGDVCKAGVAGTGQAQFNVEVGPDNYIAVSPAGSLYVADKGGEGGTRGRIQTLSANGEYESQFLLPKSEHSSSLFADNPGALAVDPKSGDLYFAFERAFSAFDAPPTIYKLSPAGAVVSEISLGYFGGHQPAYARALATDAAGDLYAVGETIFHEGGVFEFDPSGKQIASLPRKFGDPLWTGLATNVIAPGSPTPGDLYVTEVGESKSFAVAYGPAPEFEPPPVVPPEIADQYAASVDPEGALLRGKVNPYFWDDTTYYVEYGTGRCSEGGCTSTFPAAPGARLTTKHVASVLNADTRLNGLTPGTTYHFRVVAQSGGSNGQPVRGLHGEVGADGAEGTFTTPPLPPSPSSPDPCPNAAYRIGAGALLPDCRGYEMVSPVDKDGADVIALTTLLNVPARLDQGAASGEAFSFSADRAFAGSPSGGYASQYLSRRGAGGWSTEAISPLQNSGQPLHGRSLNSELDTQFRGFSANLSEAWLAPSFGPNPDPSAPSGFVNLLRRESSTGAYEGQIRILPPHYEEGSDPQFPELQGVSADGRHVLIRVAYALTPEAPDLGGGNAAPGQLYEAYREGSGPAQLRLVSVLPGGQPVETGASAGTANSLENDGFDRLDSVTHAISADGSVIYWTAFPSGASSGPGRIYARVNGEATLPVSEAVKPADSSPARFWAAAADGSSALFSFTAGAKKDTLYQYSLQAGKAVAVAGGFRGLVGESEDLSRFYFVAEEALAEGAIAGVPNLYLDQEGAFTYIGQLSTDDLVTAGVPGKGIPYTPVNYIPFYHAGAASADGQALAFMSSSPELAEAVGYDNTDQGTGKADPEIYRYSATSARLSCVSCNPSGSRPLGRLLSRPGTSASNPKFFSPAFLPNAESELHTPRYISATGSRLFFDSYEALLPRDTNGVMDVYEWEAPGNGSCAESSPSFISSSGGCLFLVSSGESPRGSEFLDASEDGSDVFFLTLSSLVPQDPNLLDVYDARVGGGFPQPPPPPGRCEGEACQGPSPDRTYPTAASAGYRGAGNVAKPPARKGACPKGRRKVTHKGKARCVKRHRAKKRAANHQGRAHR